MGLREAFARLPGFARGPRPVQAERERRSQYQKAFGRFELVDVGNPREFLVSGDHLYVSDLQGVIPIYLRTQRGAPWFRIHEGMTVTREFDRFELLAGHVPPAASPGSTEVTILTSWGPTVIERPPSPGLDAIPIFRNLTVSTAPTEIPEPPSIYGTNVPSFYTGGRRGGELWIKNTDLTNTLLVGVQRNAATPIPGGQDFFPLWPGETIALAFRQRIQRLDATKGILSVQDSILASTEVGTCDMAYLFSSREVDAGDANQSLRLGGLY